MLAVSKLSIGRVKQRAAMCLGRPQVLREECKLARGVWGGGPQAGSGGARCREQKMRRDKRKKSRKGGGNVEPLSPPLPLRTDDPPAGKQPHFFPPQINKTHKTVKSCSGKKCQTGLLNV